MFIVIHFMWFIPSQKPPRGIKKHSWKFRKIDRKTQVSESLFYKVAGLLATLLKKRTVFSREYLLDRTLTNDWFHPVTFQGSDRTQTFVTYYLLVLRKVLRKIRNSNYEGIRRTIFQIKKFSQMPWRISNGVYFK